MNENFLLKIRLKTKKNTKSIHLFGISLLMNFMISIAQAAPCCAKNPGVPELITGDNQSQMNFGLSNASVVAQPSVNGKLAQLPQNESEAVQTFRFDGATLLSDRFQVGAGVGFMNRVLSKQGNSVTGTGVGDVRLNVGYEILPEWSYSVWRPQGYLFSTWTLPTGSSAYESNQNLMNAMGNGFYLLSFGTFLKKTWGAWDAFFLSEFHYGIPRTFNEGSSTETFVMPGFGTNLGLGLGWSPGKSDWRIGLRLAPRYDQKPKSRLIGANAKTLPSQNSPYLSSTDLALDIAYLLNKNSTLILSYIDQTIIGPVYGMNLNRIFAISYQQRWDR